MNVHAAIKQAPPEDYLLRWNLRQADAEPLAETRNSVLYRVLRRNGSMAVLKHLKDFAGSDEQRGGALMAWYGEDCAAEIYEQDESAILMEFLDGPHLLDHFTALGDHETSDVIASVIMRLHGKRSTPPPAGLQPLGERFEALHQRAAQAAQRGLRDIFVITSGIAKQLIETQTSVIPLHGDVHYENILGTSRHAWKVIDPKGLMGDPAYEPANVYRNPEGRPDITRSTERIEAITRRFSTATGYDSTRILQFAAVHAALSACWDLETSRSIQAASSLDTADAILSVLQSHAADPSPLPR